MPKTNATIIIEEDGEEKTRIQLYNLSTFTAESDMKALVNAAPLQKLDSHEKNPFYKITLVGLIFNPEAPE